MSQIAERAKILIIDDELVNLDVMTGLLNKYYKLVVAKNGEQALMRLAQPPLPDLILLDVRMPGMDGFEVCRRLKSNPEYKSIPVIFITALDEVDDESCGLAMGAADYISKPFNPELVLLRISNHLELQNQRNAFIKRTSELELKTAELAKRTRELYESNQKLEALSITDGLTQISNRRHFDQKLGEEYARHIRTRAELSLILIDIDYFKFFNDHYGHVIGDECLKQVARVIANSATRPADLAARYGGEEFVCILPATDSNGAVIVAENIRLGIIALNIPHKSSKVAEHVTVSLGVVTVQCDKNLSALEIIAKADEMLYLSKAYGRNCFEFTTINSGVVPLSEQISTGLVQLVWKDTYCSGNKLIDSQHHALFELCNSILEKMLMVHTSSMIDPAVTEISAMITRLIDDVKQHFNDEMLIIEASSFPYYKQHAAEHTKLMEKALKLLQDSKTSVISIGDVVQFLAYDLITRHLFDADQAFFPFINVTA